MNLDNYKLEKRGLLNSCSNSSFVPKKTTCCNKQVLHDEELDNIFYNSDDLEQYLSLFVDDQGKSISCPICNEIEFELLEVKDEEELSSDWSWAL